jgi:hypothetical protein
MRGVSDGMGERGNVVVQGRTVDAGLEVLVACFAAQIAYALLLVDLDGHGRFVVTEYAFERRRESFALGRVRDG